MFGGYANAVKADIDEARYERCEEMFDLVDYRANLQASAQQAQVLTPIPANDSVPQAELKSVSLKDLVGCERETLAPIMIGVSGDVAKASYQCELEIDRRVDSGKVSRAKVDKMLNRERKRK